MPYYSSEEIQPTSVNDRHILAGKFYFILEFRHIENIIGIALDAACRDDDESLIWTMNNAKPNQRNVATDLLDELFLFLIVQSASVGQRGQSFQMT